jgi:hypothetical protein
MVVEVKSANILGHREYTASSTDGLRHQVVHIP